MDSINPLVISTMTPIRVAIVGVGNCASALVQGIEYYSKHEDTSGLNYVQIGGYYVNDISIVAAWDVDDRKVGKPVNEAILAAPNCCITLEDVSQASTAIIRMAPILDGVSQHMLSAGEKSFVLSRQVEDTPLAIYKELENVDVLINYLPVGSQKATEFWADCCLVTNTAFLNCIPVFIASNPVWEQKFIDAKLPMIGDDMKSQFGASIMSQMLQELALARGHHVKCHIQQNVGGNTDFLNMKNQDRLSSKKISKENVLKAQHTIQGKQNGFLFAGPSDYIEYLGDTKIATFHLELEGFAKSPVKFEAKMTVQDSPNSAGIVVDAIRFLQVAKELGISGSLRGASAFTQKSPPEQLSLEESIKECNALANRSFTQKTL